MRPDNANEDRAAVRGLPPLYFVVPLAIALALQFLVLPLPFALPAVGFLPATALRVAGGALIGVVGVALFAATVAAHRRAGNDPHPTSPTRVLITSGPYRLSRNPGYLGFALAQTGIAVAVGSFWALGSVVVSLLLAHHLAALPEEAYLERKFGERYRAYREAVRRWL
ncbi:MAG: isoprenylcysteine carboxylmethyltransferase family protein [Betaproteobacteria bacterium]|nr:isoprenylcysteine carboxylmethyltransferase family protein [Betaproteobacteria bacterium]